MISYTYQINKVFSDDGIIQVLYSSPGKPEIGANIIIPSGFPMDDIEQLIELNAPIGAWQRMENKPDISAIQVGTIGNKTYAPPTPPEPTLAEAKAQAEADIDAAATRARYRYISPNKDATYLNKSNELDRWIAAGRPAEPAPGTFPYIELEARETNASIAATGAIIEAARDAWLQLDPLIEGIARGGKVEALAATTVGDAQAAAAAAVNNLNNI